jgi:hypothetical protein
VKNRHVAPHSRGKSYRAALLETDWTQILERIQEAESAIVERKHAMALNHGGTPEERHAIAAALSGLKPLRGDVSEWQICRRKARKPSPIKSVS